MTSSAPVPSLQGKYWPWLIVALLGICLLAQGIILYAATSDPSFVIVDDYYNKALAWDDELEQQDQSRKLGWVLQVVEPRELGPAQLVVMLKDGEGQALGAAHVRLDAYLAHRSLEVRSLELAETSPGTYQALWHQDQTEFWQLAFYVEKDRQQFVKKMRLRLPVY